MSLYMTQFSYPPDDGLVFLESSQEYVFEPPFKQIGVQLHQVYCCGEGEGLIIYEAPDEATAQKAISASSLLESVKVYKTMPLFTITEIANNQANSLSVSEGPQPRYQQATAKTLEVEGYRFLGWIEA